MVHDELNFIACKKNNYCVRNSENLKNTTKYVRIRMLSKKLDGASLIPDLGPKWVKIGWTKKDKSETFFWSDFNEIKCSEI